LWRCRTLAQKGSSLQTHSEVGATPLYLRASLPAVLPTSVTDRRVSTAHDPYEQLIGAEISFGTTLIGHVEGLVRDPLSHRVRKLITTYGLPARRVAVPMEWVARRSTSRLVLGVGTRSLDDLADRVLA